jgi:signal transduction histidine kinase
MPKATRTLLVRYGAAVLATIVATLVRWLLDPVLEGSAPFSVYYAAVMFTAWCAGLGPSLVALVMGAFLADYLFIEPRVSILSPNLEHQVGLALYIAVGVSRRRLEAAHAEQQRAQQLLLEHQQHQRELVETELMKVKEQLIRQTRLATIGQISASIAHDLRNSLFVISGATYLLKESIPDASSESAEHAGLIDREINTINRIISNLMELARGKQSTKSQVNLGEVLQEAFDRVRKPEDRLSIQLSTTPFLVDADPVQLGQVLGNLMANSVEAMPDGGEIRVCARNDGEMDTIVLEDDGPGIPPDIRDQVFEPLVSGKPKGTGLGLAICRQIIERHGGTIEVMGKQEPGAAFAIRLPCAESTA